MPSLLRILFLEATTEPVLAVASGPLALMSCEASFLYLLLPMKAQTTALDEIYEPIPDLLPQGLVLLLYLIHQLEDSAADEKKSTQNRLVLGADTGATGRT